MNDISKYTVYSRYPEKLLDADNSLLHIINNISREDNDYWSLKDRDRKDSAHRIFQYPAMMVPLVQRRLMATIREVQPSIKSLYDPFVGAGTSLVTGMHFGMDVYGNDINPLAVLISRVRTCLLIDLNIGYIGEEVACIAASDTSDKVETRLNNIDKWFKPQVARELSCLRRAIRKQNQGWIRRFLWVTLAETVRLTSNDRTSTYKLHTRTQEDIESRKLSPIEIFKSVAQENSNSFSFFQKQLMDAKTFIDGNYISKTNINLADTCEDLNQLWRGEAPFDLLMTSPPYGDNHTTITYGEHSYLPLNWIDFYDIDIKAEENKFLSTTKEIDRRSLGGKSDLTRQQIEQVLAASPNLKEFVDQLPSEPKDGRDRLLRFYVAFFTSLQRIIGLIQTNGYMVWTVGNRSIGGKQVPTNTILADLLEGMGGRCVTTLTRQIHHKRMPNRNASSATMREEKILIFRKTDTEMYGR
jgi:hypothetical protein